MIVWVTREENDDGPLATALRGHGLDVVVEPVIARRIVADPAVLLADLGPDDWLVLTSPYAIESAACAAARIPNVAVVGAPSRAVAERLGLRVALVGDGHGASVFRTLRETVSCGTVCYPRSALAEVPDAWPGVTLTSPVLYDTTRRVYDESVAQRVEVIAVASPSAAHAVGPRDLRYASIGATTSAAVRDIGRTPWVEASTPSFPALAKAIADNR